MEDKYSYLQRKSIKLPVNSYLQTTPTTCIAASALMMFNYFEPGKYPLTEEKEMEIHRIIRFWEGGFGEYGSYPKLAKYAIENGYDVTMLMEGPRKPNPLFLPHELFDQFMEEFLPYIDELVDSKNFNIINGPFEYDDLHPFIEKGLPILVEINYPTSYPTHNIVIRGHKNSYIRLVDPINSYQNNLVDRFNQKVKLDYMQAALIFSKQNNLEKIINGIPASEGEIEGIAKVLKKFDPITIRDDLKNMDFNKGNILVAPRTDPQLTSLMTKAGGIITDTGSITCHAAVVSRELDIPCIVGTELYNNKGTEEIQDGDIISLKVNFDENIGEAKIKRK